MFVPVPLRVAEWVIPAFAVLWTAVSGRGAKWTVPLLVIAPMVRTTSYLWAWVTYLWADGARGEWSGWYIAMLHVTFLGLVVVAALLTGKEPAGEVAR